jgi:hypothetical protein
VRLGSAGSVGWAVRGHERSGNAGSVGWVMQRRVRRECARDVPPLSKDDQS